MKIQIHHPSFIYGTAWKEDRTEALVIDALHSGFTGIDTANQRKHYFEAAVGKGIAAFLKESDLTREDLFLQTKFTYQNGQDHRLPYDPKEPLAVQVLQSFESSLDHLQSDYIDSYLLHGPFDDSEMHENDYEVWSVMEKLYAAGKVKKLGISNVKINYIKELYDKSHVKPHYVQNRCYASTYWDREIRNFCSQNKITYQGFSLLTANVHELMQESIEELCIKYKKTIPQIAFRFSQQVGMIPLTGTKNTAHMKQDLHIEDFELTPQELESIENISF